LSPLTRRHAVLSQLIATQPGSNAKNATAASRLPWPGSNSNPARVIGDAEVGAGY
jgi:hypothetical protein